ncbi:hypothetical protein V501_05362 [Pseudogymnoascus sp. VKM F-4519 (FW-2642)]|nr:hypothetical protein V501_05362 [Pseudogymnoascus sp. VKM F-4519 (FW-2642)]
METSCTGWTYQSIKLIIDDTAAIGTAHKDSQLGARSSFQRYETGPSRARSPHGSQGERSKKPSPASEGEDIYNGTADMLLREKRCHLEDEKEICGGFDGGRNELAKAHSCKQV